MIEVVDGNDNVSCSDNEVSEESSTGSFTRLSSPWENVCVVQCESRCDDVRVLKGFSQICSKVGVEPK